MSDVLIGCIKQSQAHKLEEIRQNRKDIKIGCIKQSLGGLNENPRYN